MVSFVLKPDEANAQMPGAIRKFELMPNLELAEDDVRKIVNFVYETDFGKPGWYEKHYKEEHGSD